jgi:AcrR family transcriptional regulator
MGKDQQCPPARPLRADARDNRERVLRAARSVFAEPGAHPSLNRIAQTAGVGPGTLYRHFPTLQALLVALISDDVDALCATGRELLTHSSPDDALRLWLRAVAIHATAMNGLVAGEMLVEPSAGAASALADCHEAIRVTGAALLARAQRDGETAADVDMLDLLKLTGAIAWASQQSPEDKGLLDRLLALAVGRNGHF